MSAASLPVAVLLLALVGVSACGGDNLSLCDGCETPTPTVTPTPTPTLTPTPIPTPSPTPPSP